MEAKQLFTIDENGKLTIHFHPGQTCAWESESPVVVVLAGRQSGKSSFAPWWLWREIIRTGKYGEENDYLAGSATNDLFHNAFLPAMQKVFCETLDIGYYWSSRRTIELKSLDPDDPRYGQFYQGPNGNSSGLMWGRIILRSAASDGSFESMTAKAAVLDEAGQAAFTLQDWEAVQGRVSLSRSQGAGRILITTTPYDLGWIYANLYTPWLQGSGHIDIIQFPSWYNPNFSMEEYQRQKASMPSWRAAMFLDGKFERPAGLILRDFDESTMVVRTPFPIPNSWERVVGVDFGGANTATVWLALNPNDGRWYLYHETLMGHLPASEHASIAASTAVGIERLTAVGGAKSEGQPRDDWWYAGFYIEEPPTYHVEAGIARIISLIKKDKLRIFSSCTRILSEIKSYRRKLDANNEPTEQIVNKNRFHGIDSLRYASAWIEDAPPGVDIMSYQEYMDGQYASA